MTEPVFGKAVKESVTEFVTEYAFSFIGFDNLFLVNFQAFER